MDDGTGIATKQFFGKTLRGEKQKCRVFVVKRCNDEVVCPVEGLFKYTQGCKNMDGYYKWFPFPHCHREWQSYESECVVFYYV